MFTGPLNDLNTIKLIFIDFEHLEKVVSFMILSIFGFVYIKKKLNVYFWQYEITQESYSETPISHNSINLSNLFKIT